MEGVLQNMVIPRAGFIRATPGIKPVGRPGSDWSVEIEEAHRLQSIQIGHSDNVIQWLIFTMEVRGKSSISSNFGRMAGGQTVSLVTLDSDEEIIGIKVSTGLKGRDTYLSSLSFETNKTTHGPFGGTTNSMFSLPWDKGSLVGFHGIVSDWIPGIGGIGVYLKAHEEIMRIGTWGKSSHLGSPHNKWSFQLETNHHLKKITIDHGDLIYSLIFTTQYGELTYTSDKIGGWGRGPLNDGDKISEITFDADEEINGISGTVALSRGDNPGFIIISSISFVTNKKTHGPFGTTRGDPFSALWEDGTVAGFYGLCGGYLDSIGVYLKATNR